MKYSNLFFNKDLYALTFADIESFFQTSKEESLNLEFKSYVAQGEYARKEEAIKKSTCALLNSEGGIIIWGAPVEVRDAQGNTTAVGALTPFASALDRDRIINILSSSITPLPIGIRVQVLRNDAGNSIFVTEVEKSIEKPHQYDNKYFVRLDGQTRIAPHYLISALMKSKDFPIIKGHLRLKRIQTDASGYLFHFRKLLYNTSPFINDVNIYMAIVALPGTIFVNGINEGAVYKFTFPILSNGTPLMSDFILRLTNEQISQEIKIVFQFGGEKSPSKISSYKYQMGGTITSGIVRDETIYLTEKSENKMPSDITNNTVEQNIEILLNG